MSSPLDRMAEFNRKLAELAKDPNYQRSLRAELAAELMNLGWEANPADMRPAVGTGVYLPDSELEKLHDKLDNAQNNYASPRLNDAWTKYKGYRVRDGADGLHKTGRAIAKGAALPFLGTALGISTLYRFVGVKRAEKSFKQARKRSAYLLTHLL